MFFSNKNAIVLFLLVSLFSCKTAEEIRREKVVDSMEIQMVQFNKVNGDITVRLQEIEERLGMLRGELEKSGYDQKEINIRNSSDLNAQILVLREGFSNVSKMSEENNSQIKLQREDFNEQKNYLKKILKSLTGISSKQKRAEMNSYDGAMADYRAGKYTLAKGQLQALLNDKSVRGKRRARLFHNLGMVAFIKKDYNSALTYFSKLFTKYPNVSYNPNGLLYLGKSFMKLKKNDEARHTFMELTSRYPKSSSGKKAKKLLKKLKK